MDADLAEHYLDSLYDSNPPYGIVQLYNQYICVEYCSIEILKSHIYLILDRSSGRYNMYIVDCYVKNWRDFEEFIVENYKAKDLDLAWFCFPQYGLNENNYGF